VFEVIATGGDSALGGDDYDDALAAWVAEKTGTQLESAADKTAWRIAARNCKQALTESEVVAFTADVSWSQCL
jgi:molecular chaperone HscA